MVRAGLHGFLSISSRDTEQKDHDKQAEMMDEREDDLSINLPSAVPPFIHRKCD